MSRLIKLNLTFKNTEATDAIRNYASEKLTTCIQKYVHQDTEAHAVLRVEKNRHIAEISFRSDGNDFRGSEESDNLYASIDRLVDSLGTNFESIKRKSRAIIDGKAFDPWIRGKRDKTLSHRSHVIQFLLVRWRWNYGFR